MTSENPFSSKGKIVIPGGTGQVGHILARGLSDAGYQVVVLSRNPSAVVPGARVMSWDAVNPGTWYSEIDGADAIINLAGRSVNCRYTPENRRLIMESRVNSAKAVGAAIAAAPTPPRVWLQASTATIYSHRFDAPNDEHTGAIGGNEPDAPDTWRFSIQVARAWEQALADADTPGTRKVAMRSAMVMSPDKGGIFDTLLTLVKRGLGGNAAGGHQYVSWVHEEDFVAAVLWLLQHEELSGAVNIASPNPLPYREFIAALRQAAHMPIGLPATRLMLEIGAIFMRTETELVLKSRRVIPSRLLESGFQFRHPNWSEAAQSLLQS